MEGQCVSCLIRRGFEEVKLATSNPTVQMQVMTALVKILHDALYAEDRITQIPAYVGTLRDQTVQKLTGCNDPYAVLKRQSNEAALKLLPKLQTFVKAGNGESNQFRRATLIASLGNIIEYGVQGHVVPWDRLEHKVTQVETEMAVDHIDQLLTLVEKSTNLLYLTDNAGEVVFDRVLIEVLANHGLEVTVAVKGAPALNDAMMADAKAAGLQKYAQIITTGGGSIGVLPQWCSRDFLDRFPTSDLVIAKGMAHTETLPEFSLPTPTALLLRTKCEPVARYLGVPKGRNVVKVLANHKGPLGPITGFV